MIHILLAVALMQTESNVSANGPVCVPPKVWMPKDGGIACIDPPPIVVASSEPAPLKCGKYQHVEEKQEASCHGGTCKGMTACASIAICEPEVPAHCADDLKTVTVEEWVKLMERLKTLEAKAEGR